jgi:hypothetical protein
MFREALTKFREESTLKSMGNTKASKRSSQEIQAIRGESLDYLRPLVPAEDELTATHPRFVAWFVNGRKVGE